MVVILITGIVLNFDPTGTIHHGDMKLTDETRKVRKMLHKLKIKYVKLIIRSDVAKSIETSIHMFEQK